MASTHRRAVGIFPSRTQTASALQALNDSGFSMGDVSVIAKDADQQNDIAGITVEDEVTNQADTGGTIGAATGGILGGVTGLLVGLGTLTIPGLGPVLLAGEAAAVLSTLVGGVAGATAGGILGALVGLGIPEHRAKRYRDRVAQGDYLVMLKGRESDIARAERTLGNAGIEDWGVYPMTDQPRRGEPKDHRSSTTPVGSVHTVANGSAAVGDRPLVNDSNARPQSTVRTRVPETVPRQRQDDSRRDALGDSAPVAEDYRSTIGLPYPSDSNDSRNLSNFGSTAVADLSRAEERRVVGVFLSRDRMEDALAQLQQTGFPMHTLSFAVRESEAPEQRQDPDSHSLAGATRLTAGLDRVLLPEVGTVLVMGPDAQALVDTFRSAANGSEGGADGLGIAPESAHLYRRHLISGAYLVTLRGDNQDLLQAASTLGEQGMHDWGIYDVSRSDLSHR